MASRVGSFTLAAKELYVSQGAISRHIAHLEDYLGVQLFDRCPREVKLTPAGALYAKEIQIAFDRIQRTTTTVRETRRRNSLRVGIFPSIAAYWLMPRLARFRTAHPDIELYITTTSHPDLDNGDLDIANYRGRLASSAVEYHPLFDVELQPVCSPHLVNGESNVDPEKIRGMLLLCSQNRIEDWQLWLDHAGVRGVDPNQGLKFENSALVYQAAIDGLGIGIAHANVVQGEFMNRRLIAPFEPVVRTNETYGLAWLKSKSNLPGLMEFKDWFVAESATMGQYPPA
ncbi:LysR substrate-binding domain-containing protein [Terrarubrum flagellatum]|uniref:LysR substrate-binding domain-containing protein n=1 Tax=Terrirubrum flagellatum TaxID=2895980 RepID=UPI0031456C12